MGMANLEAAENFISAFTSYEYLPISKDYLYFDTGLIIIKVISWVNNLFHGVQLLSYFIYLSTFFASILLLNLLKKILKQCDNYDFYISMLIVIILLPNFLSISITRASFIFSLCFFLAFHYKLLSKWQLASIYTVSFLLRLDLIIFLTVLYFISSVIYYRKIKLKILSISIFSISLFFAYNALVDKVASEPFKAFYYHELDIGDRGNINLTSLSDTEFLILNAVQNGIMDEKIFDRKFIKNILYSDNSFWTNVLLAPSLYLNVLKNSLPNFHSSWPLILICILLILSSIIRTHQKNKLLTVALFSFPFLACFYISLPDRFIYPYYSFLFIYLVTNMTLEFSSRKLIIYTITITTVGWISITLFKKGEETRSDFYTTMGVINNLNKQFGDTLFFETAINTELNFINTDIKHRYSGNNIHFLNLFHFQAFDNYKSNWESIGCTNYLSVLEKVKTVQRKKQPIIFTTKDRYLYFKKYLENRYNYFEDFEHYIIYKH